MLRPVASLSGKLSTGDQLVGKLTTSASLVGKLSMPVGYADYTGSCDVVPTVKAQTLHTKDKHMTDDVRIKAIPYFNVSNTAGGSTIYIGSEVE